MKTELLYCRAIIIMHNVIRQVKPTTIGVKVHFDQISAAFQYSQQTNRVIFVFYKPEVARARVNNVISLTPSPKSDFFIMLLWLLWVILRDCAGVKIEV